LDTQDTQWVVIDGPPSSGKTTIINRLKRRGFMVVKEAARAIINEGRARGKSIEEIRVSEVAFNRKILARQIANERRRSPHKKWILDSGIPKSIVYFTIYGVDIQQVIDASFTRRYRIVFMLRPLPWKADYGRTEKNPAVVRKLRSFSFRRQAYERVGYRPITVPVFCNDRRENIERRLRFIEERL
jgi:predicted ATPase